MTWTKLGDEALWDPDFLDLPRGVRLLHLEALVYTNRYGGTGKITVGALHYLTDEPNPEVGAARLVEAGLWEAASLPLYEGAPGEWRIRYLMDDQPAADEQEAARQLWRDRQARHRRHLAGNHSTCNPAYCAAAQEAAEPSRKRTRDSRVRRTRDKRLPDPTRPDPTRPLGGEEGRGVRGTGKPGRREVTNRTDDPAATHHSRAQAIADNRALLEDPDTPPAVRRAAAKTLERLEGG